MRLERLHRFPIHTGRLFADQSEHVWLTRPVDIRVEQADPRTVSRQRQRQIDSNRRLADTTLAGRHGDHISDLGQRFEIALHAVRDNCGCQFDIDLLVSASVLDSLGNLLPVSVVRRLRRKTKLHANDNASIGFINAYDAGDLTESKPDIT